MKKIFGFILLTIILFSGCSVIKENNDSFKFKYIHSTSVTDFDDLTADLLAQMCDKIKQVNNKRIPTPLYVVDFVNLKDLNNKSELGFMLSDELKTHVTQSCDMGIYSLEYSKYVKIGKEGTKLLSRDTKDLKNTKVNRNTYALIGTYTLTQRQLILYLKLIDLKTGVIVKAATEKTTLTDEILKLEEIQKPIVDPESIYQPVVL